MQNIKPIYVIHEEGVEQWQIEAVTDGISELLKLADVAEDIEIVNLGVWREKQYKGNSQLMQFQSIDWYIQRGRETSSRRNQINAYTIVNYLAVEPWRVNKPHYDVVIIKSDIYSGSEDNNFLIGIAIPEIGTVVSLDKFLQLKKTLQYECIKTETMHEMGHVFDLIPDRRTQNVEYSLGKHCTNICIMRQGLRLPVDWVNMTNDRLQRGPLCDQCHNDLLSFFNAG